MSIYLSEDWDRLHEVMKNDGKGVYNKDAECSFCRKEFINPKSGNTRVVSWLDGDQWYHFTCFEQEDRQKWTSMGRWENYLFMKTRNKLKI